MSFFTLSDGNGVQANGTMEMGGGDLQPIPKGTKVLAAIDEAKIGEYQGARHVSLRWTIAQPEQFKNRKIFQKVHCFDADSAKRDKALRMLAAIDANAGGKLVASGQEPNDMNLTSALSNKLMVLDLDVWESEDKSKNGNWVRAVSPRKQGAQPQPQPVAQQQAAISDDDIPF